MGTTKHTLSSEMKQVHDRMLSQYKLDQQAAADVAKAKKMEYYLRAFKFAGDNYYRDSIKPTYETMLDQEAMSLIANQVAMRLNLGQKQGNSLFRWTHQMGYQQGLKVGADDIFEAELYNLLTIAGEQAIEGVSSIPLGVSMIGNMPANISKEFMQELQIQGQGIITRTNKSSEFIDMPKFRSGKVDVTGYNSTFAIEANIKPQWQDFINTFSGAKMTLKNYSSTAGTEVIHLGNTNPAKAIISSLADLHYNAKEATHIFYHLTGGRKKYSGPQTQGAHIIHLRFAYELTGGKLTDSQGNDLEKADFFVYNDPSTSNIWVRSTKAMIAEMTRYAGTVGDPLHSGIVVLKLSF